MSRSSLLTLFLLAISVTAFSPILPIGKSSSTTTPTSTSLFVAIDTSDIKNGMTVELDNEPYKVLSFSIMKQARGAAKTTIKFKNLIRGTTIENTYRSGEKFETALIEKKAAQFTYKDDNNNYFFMDSETFEEKAVNQQIVDDKEKWIAEGMEVNLIYFKDRVIEVAVPSNYIYEIVDTEPNAKGNTAQGHTKPATLDCGAVINIPGYLNQGEKIKVDTEKGVYLERVQ